MTITNYTDLWNWFRTTYERGVNSTSEDKEDRSKSPYWTLYNSEPGATAKIIAQNTSLTNVTESWEMLRENIRMTNNPQGTVFRVFVTSRPKGNVATGEVRVQIYESVVQPAAVAGINGYAGGGAVMDEAAVNAKIQEARRQWELERKVEDLEAALESKPDPVERIAGFAERFMTTPLGQVIALRLLGGQPDPATMQAAAAAMNGLPQQPQQPEPGEATSDEPHNEFDTLMDEITGTLQTDDLTLLRSLRALVAQNPVMAKQLLTAANNPNHA